MCNPVKKTYLRFFFKSQLFSDGYRCEEGDCAPYDSESCEKTPVLDVKSHNLAELDIVIANRAVGFTLFDIITTQVEDSGRMVELTSGEINRSGRYFFQFNKDYGRVATKDEAPQEYDRHTYMRRYHHAPIPEKIILFLGAPRRLDYCDKPVCTFDFLETDTLVPVRWDFMSQGYIQKPAEKAA